MLKKILNPFSFYLATLVALSCVSVMEVVHGSFMSMHLFNGVLFLIWCAWMRIMGKTHVDWPIYKNGLIVVTTAFLVLIMILISCIGTEIESHSRVLHFSLLFTSTFCTCYFYKVTWSFAGPDYNMFGE